ncbi:MAG: hypothetical protein ABFS38_14555 [Bacteroidota bacterium]
MSEKLLKIIIYAAGAFSLFAFVAIRSLPVMNSVLVEKIIPEHWEFTRYGDLYYFNYISHFKEDLPTPVRKYRYSDKHPEPSEAEILIFGDSFLDFSRQLTLPERLNDTLPEKVFYHRFLSPQQSNPLCVLSDYNIRAGDPKIVIYQAVERNIAFKFDKPYTDSLCGHDPESELSSADRVAKKVFPGNDEEMYRQLLKKSVFTSALFGLSSTLKFNLFGYISGQTPVYKTGENPWLFFNKQLDDEPGSYYYDYSMEEIERYCDNIAFLSRQLEEKMNMKLVFLPIPNKYTLYHTVVNDDPYFEFLPLLQAGLKERNVTCVELYEDFLNADEVLYYGTDTHWNKKGVDITLENLLKTLNAL